MTESLLQYKGLAIAYATKFLVDDTWWPGTKSRYYLGLVPQLTMIPYATVANEGMLGRHQLAKLFHTESIRITGFIWSLRMRYRAEIIKERVRHAQDWHFPEASEDEYSDVRSSGVSWDAFFDGENQINQSEEGSSSHDWALIMEHGYWRVIEE